MPTIDPAMASAPARAGHSSSVPPVQNHLFAHTPFFVVYDCP
ncbi:hypothetical protein [Sphaerisporangium rubeum]|uniref:Uncharacterized protein n=1 Tax=Sphaerisporangium rubeum TaxID=321317 RepID=A0A7X0ID54_9ACTN|nr:hypothetical protein [Sphaerisporangium rubeum]MBB6472314.1 hypothetical protein [Sphaerisporangium rubeum]